MTHTLFLPALPLAYSKRVPGQLRLHGKTLAQEVEKTKAVVGGRGRRRTRRRRRRRRREGEGGEI